MVILAYHFTGDKLRDGSPIPPIGETLVFTEPLRICNAGYHASRTAWNALGYAPGNMLHRVHCGGEVIEVDDKLVCSERTIVASIDAGALLREFARSCASDVLHLWNAPDVVREYLESGDKALMSAARAAAESAAAAVLSAAAAAAARAAEKAAARAAAAAAESAARAAAAAAAAARAAAESAAAAVLSAAAAAEAAQEQRFTNMVNAAFEAS